jgi:2-dehydro-3-deoxyphosphogluconate aldolase/(4S)-4-hydroxy-2-oxoglutarate aldolase
MPKVGEEDAVLRRRVIAIVRARDAAEALRTGIALVDAGLDVVEVSFNTPAAADAIRALAAERPQAFLGAGTVLDPASAEAAVEAGARFLLSPSYVPAVGEYARAAGVLYIPGVFTATELWQAVSAGWSTVKIFPASVLSPAGLRALLEPFPGVATVPTGGVGLHQVEEWLAAGARALGIGGALTRASDVTAAARDLVERLAAWDAAHHEIPRR